MRDFILYKDYIGSVHFNAEDEVFYGKIEGIEDLVSFEGTSVVELKKAFNEAVDDYLRLCEEAGKKNEKSYKGSFNVRIPPEIHKRAKRITAMKGMSLNQFVQKAVEKASGIVLSPEQDN
jgi:predicted HicB family RNase H-like nuclease